MPNRVTDVQSTVRGSVTRDDFGRGSVAALVVSEPTRERPELGPKRTI
jgi:hypothetical protein